MSKIWVLHSFKGGSGKTLISINLAAMLVKRGSRVALLDLDIHAPSLQTYVESRKEKKINDLLTKKAELKDIIFDATHILGNPAGKLYMCLSDVSGEAISKLSNRSKSALIEDLYILMDIVKNKLPKAPYNVDYIILDTSPGLSTTSINAVAMADALIVLMKLSNADLGGTYQFLNTIHRVLKPPTKLIINQVPGSFLDKVGMEKTSALLDQKIMNKIDKNNISFIGRIDYDESIINLELEFAFNYSGNEELRPIHCFINPKSKFSLSMNDIIDKLIEEI